MGLSNGMKLGEFEVEGELGKGGMAAVLRGIHVPTGIGVALKVAFDGQAATEDFAREVHAVARMVHPSIVTVFDHGTTPDALDLTETTIPAGAPWLAMELADGSLTTAHVCDWTSLREVLLTVLDALAHAHARGVIHRDIKPDNILVRSTAGSLDVALSDFGIAHLTSTRAPTDSGSSSAGTPRYMAPEQFTGRECDLGPPTDLYALACVAWELATSKPPFEAPTVIALGVLHYGSPPPPFEPQFDVPEGFEQWLRRLLAKQPAERYRFAALAARALEALDPTPAPMKHREVINLGRVAAIGPGLFGIRELPLVGRAAECRFLWEQLSEVVRSGLTSVVVVHGAAGTGKSKIASWLACRAHELGIARHMKVDCRNDVLGGLEYELSHLLGIRGMTRSQAAERIAARAEADEEVGHITALLRNFLSDGDDLEALTASPRKQALSVALRLAASDTALVLWLDDAVWDPVVVEIAEILVEGQSPILFVATARTEHTIDRPDTATALRRLAEQRGAVAELEPLPPAECRELVRVLLPLDDRAVEQVVQRSAGNPLFAVQLVADWVQREVLRWSGGGLRAVRLHETTVPTDVSDLWLARVDDVLGGDSGDRQAMLLAVTLGHSVNAHTWLAACASLGVNPSQDLPERLVRRRLATWIDGGFSFAHGLLVDALRAVIPLEREVVLHAACGEALERSRDWATLGRAGRHWLAAQQPKRALESLVDAAGGANLHQRYAAAQELAALAKQAAVHAGVPAEQTAVVELIALKAHRNFTPLAEFLEQVNELTQRARESEWTTVLARCLELRGPTHNGLGDPGSAVEDLFEAADLFADLGDEHRRSSVLMSLTYILSFAEQSDEAVEIGEEALRLAEHLGREGGIATACDRLAFAVRHSDPERSTSLKRRGLELAERQGMLELQGHLLDALGSRAYDDGDLDGAVALYLDAERRFETAGVPVVWMSRFNRGYVELRRGNIEDALALFEPASKAFEEFGVYNYVTYGRAGLFACCALTGDLRGAAKWLGELEAAVASWHVKGKMLTEPARMGATALADSAPELAERAARLDVSESPS